MGRSSTGSKVLVILEPKLDQADYSLFFGGLRGAFCALDLIVADNITERGYELTFRAPKDTAPELFMYDVPQFNHVILFAPTSKSTPQHSTTVH